MSLKSFRDEIEKDLRSPAYLIHANNYYILEEAVSAVKSRVPEQERDFNFTVFDMDSPDNDPTPDEIINTLKTVSFFSSRRYAVIKNFQKMKAKEAKKIQSYISSPSPDAVLILLFLGTLKQEAKDKYKGSKIISVDIRPGDLPGWIKEKSKEKGLDIKADAVDYLIGTVGADIGLLASEIEKLSIMGKDAITIESIRDIVEGSREYSTFDFTRALDENNPDKAFRIFKTLNENTDPFVILGGINWHYARMAAQKSENAASRERYRKIFELLNDTDLQIKSGESYPLEHLIVRLLRI